MGSFEICSRNGSTELPQAELRKEAAEMTGKLSRSGAQDQNRGDDLIAAQEEKLARLLKEREALIA